MKIASPSNFFPQVRVQTPTTPKEKPLELSPSDELAIGRVQRRLNDPISNGFRSGLLGAGSAVLVSRGGFEAAAGTLAAAAGGAIAGYHVGRAIENASSAESSSNWTKNASAIGAGIGAGLGIALAFSGSPLISGATLSLAALSGSFVANRESAAH